VEEAGKGAGLGKPDLQDLRRTIRANRFEAAAAEVAQGRALLVHGQALVQKEGISRSNLQLLINFLQL